MTQLLPPKKDVALALLERSNVDVHLDPRAKGVVVPPQFRKEPRLVLKIGLNMPVAIPDLRLDDESMSCTLSFSRTPFYCVVPWPSVFAMVGEDGRGMVWPDDVPQELAERVNDRRPGPSAVPSPPPDRAEPVRDAASPKGKGKARVVVAEAPPAGASSASPERADRAGRPKRSKKKKGEEQQRPVLVAVPAPSRSEEEHPDHAEPAEQAAKESAKEPEPETRTAGPVPVPAPAAARSPVSPAPPSPVAPVPGGGATKQGTPNRPKRELPPYLRVVK